MTDPKYRPKDLISGPGKSIQSGPSSSYDEDIVDINLFGDSPFDDPRLEGPVWGLYGKVLPPELQNPRKEELPKFKPTRSEVLRSYRRKVAKWLTIRKLKLQLRLRKYYNEMRHL